MYKCKCGRKFEKSQSYIAHCSHCEIHLGYKPKDRLTHEQRVYTSKKLVEYNKKKRKSLEDILANKVKYPTNWLKERLFNEGLKERKCECCGIVDWMNSPISFELHHEDGDNTNHELKNLRVLCPNCHSQTKTFKGRNRKK